MTEFSDQISDFEAAEAANRLGIVSVGAQQRLASGFIPGLLQRRMVDFETWHVAHFRGVVQSEFDVSGVGTETFAVEGTGEGGIHMITTDADNDNAFLHPHATQTAKGVTGFWSTNNEPFCIARVLVGPVDAQQLTEIEAVVGLDIIDTYTGKDASASGETDAARWQVTNAAAAANWFTEVSTASGTDVQVDSGVVSQRASYVTLGVFLDSDRKAHFYSDLQGKGLIKFGSTSGELDVDTVMCPSIGVQVNNAGADDVKGMVVAWAFWGQRVAARL